jgi:hypothetical protein
VRMIVEVLLIGQQMHEIQMRAASALSEIPW